ncbi:hypothetical protein IT409_01995 [Candidatus Falkowbacteria bacterium]|nr:hypothetical protein [Candidatus Falkowbacteria bacterium]
MKVLLSLIVMLFATQAFAGDIVEPLEKKVEAVSAPTQSKVTETTIVDNEVRFWLYCDPLTYTARVTVSSPQGNVDYEILGYAQKQKISFAKNMQDEIGKRKVNFWLDFSPRKDALTQERIDRIKQGFQETECLCSCRCFKKPTGKPINILLAPDVVQVGLEVLLETIKTE